VSIFDNLMTLTKAKWKSFTRSPQHDSLPSLQFDVLVWRQWKSLKGQEKSKNVSFKLKQEQEHTWLQQLNEENYDSWRPKCNGFIHSSWKTINFWQNSWIFETLQVKIIVETSSKVECWFMCLQHHQLV